MKLMEWRSNEVPAIWHTKPQLTCDGLFDLKQRLTLLHLRPCWRKYGNHSPGHFALDGIEHLHRFDHANDLPFLYMVTDTDKCHLVGSWCQMENPLHRGPDDMSRSHRRHHAGLLDGIDLRRL